MSDYKVLKNKNHSQLNRVNSENWLSFIFLKNLSLLFDNKLKMTKIDKSIFKTAFVKSNIEHNDKNNKSNQ